MRMFHPMLRAAAGVSEWLVYSGDSFDVSPYTTYSITVFFKPDGTKMYFSSITTGVIYQTTLSTAWDLSTAGTVTNATPKGTADGKGIYIKPDGLQLYYGVSGSPGSDVYRYTMSTPWDITTASSASDTRNIKGGHALLKYDDGTKLYHRYQNRVEQWSTNTPWTVGSSNSDSVIYTLYAGVGGLHFIDDGSYFVTGNEGAATIHRYDLSTAWDLSTTTYNNTVADVSQQDSNPAGVFINSDASYLFMMGSNTNKIYKYIVNSQYG